MQPLDTVINPTNVGVGLGGLVKTVKSACHIQVNSKMEMMIMFLLSKLNPP